MPLGAWALVNTTVIETDGVFFNREMRVAGNRVLRLPPHSVGSVQFWRSDDRGETWSTFTIPGYVAGQTVFGIGGPHAGNWWLHNSTVAGGLLTSTPEADPGAGGFVDNAVPLTNPGTWPTRASGFMNLHRAGTGANLFRQLPEVNLGSTGFSSNFWAKPIPFGGETDLLLMNNPVGNRRVIRVTASNPLVIVNSIELGLEAFIDTVPYQPLGAVSATEFYAGQEVDGSLVPTRIWRTVNGGTSWTETNLTVGFWNGVPGVIADSAHSRVGRCVAFTRFGGATRCIVTYFNTGNPAQDRRHARVALFNEGTLTWDQESDDTTDGIVVYDAASGVNGSGGLDFYVVTYDPAVDTTRVYRLTQAAVGGLPGILNAWGGRSALGGRRPQRRRG